MPCIKIRAGAEEPHKNAVRIDDGLNVSSSDFVAAGAAQSARSDPRGA
jgi:hypothetical protein